MTDPAALDAALDELDASIGLDRLRCLHVNDSKAELGSNRDRHDNVGEGLMGEGLGVFLANPRLQGLPALLETPGPDGHGPDAAQLRRHARAARALAVTQFGGQNATGTLRRVLLRAPRPAGGALWREYGWRAAPDPALHRRRARGPVHAARGRRRRRSCSRRRRSSRTPTPSTCSTRRSSATAARSSCARARSCRLAEADAIALDLEAAGVPVVARLDAPATAEGGDTLWLDERTLLVGRGYRTNAAGIEALASGAPGRRRPRLRPPALARRAPR